MTLLLGISLKVAVLLLVALSATALLGRRSAAVRHWVLASAVLASAAMPVGVLLPAWSLPIPAVWLTSETGSTLRLSQSAVPHPSASPIAVSSETAARGDNVPNLLVWIWGLGVITGMGMLGAGLTRVRRLASRSEPLRDERWLGVARDVSRQYGVRRPVALLLSPHPTMVVTWGLRRPTILLPEDASAWSDDRIQVVLRHELAHVCRGDWAVIVMAAVLRSLHWFNPLAWIACRRLRHEGERACDDLVLSAGISGADYATHLLDVARHVARADHPHIPVIAIAHPSTLEGRIRAMLNSRVNREPLNLQSRAIALAIVFATTLPLGLVSLSARTGIEQDVLLQPSAPEAQWSALAGPATRSAVSRLVPEAAQATAGTVEGVLYDQFGGLLPGASVTLVHTSTGGRYNATTDPGGTFAFRALPPGDYQLTTSLIGFTTVNNVVRIGAGQGVRRQITLPIGTIQETIAVTCADFEPGVPLRQSIGTRRAVSDPAPSLFSGGIGGQIRVPHKITHVSPVCPTAAQRAPSVVQLVGRIGIDGLITDLREVSDEYQPALVASALEAARQWEFTPTLLNNVPIEVNISITVDYSWQR